MIGAQSSTTCNMNKKKGRLGFLFFFPILFSVLITLGYGIWKLTRLQMILLFWRAIQTRTKGGGVVDGMAAFFAWHRRFLEYLGEDLASKKLLLDLAWLGLDWG